MGKGKSIFKGVEFELNYAGYSIGKPINISFEPYAGNDLLNLDCQMHEKSAEWEKKKMERMLLKWKTVKA